MERETFSSEEGQGVGGRSMNHQAVEIMARMKANNYYVTDSGSVISFRGTVARSYNQAFFLIFCTGVGLVSLVLVFQIQF